MSSIPVSTVTTQQTASELAGPSWLVERRTAAAARADELPLPSFEQEEWRYTPIGDLDLGRYVPLVPDAGEAAGPGEGSRSLEELEEAAGPWRALLGPTAAVVLVRDGAVVAIDVDHAWAAKGLRVSGLGDGDARRLGSAVALAADKLVALNDSLLLDAVVIDVPRGLEVAEPVLVVQTFTADGALVQPRLHATVGDNAGLAVVEVQTSAAVSSLSLPVTELVVAHSGRLAYTSVQGLAPTMWQLGALGATVASQATARIGLVGLGGDYARLRTDCRLEGRGASAELSAAYFADGNQVLDYRSFQHHLARDTHSDLLFKGAIDDSARSVYSGMVHIHSEARGSNAFQTNRNIKLSPEAWAESVPNLEIENNDVRCSHASTVGPVDPDQLFYLESRGVPTAVAERLIVAGFFEDVLRRLPTPQVGPWVRDRLQQILEHREETHG